MARWRRWACCWRLFLAQRTARIAGAECRPGVEPVRRGAVCGAGGAAAAAGGAQLERSAPSSRVDAGAGHDSSSAAGGARERWRALVAAVLYARWQQAAACARRPMRWPRRWRWDWPLSNSARCWPARAMEPRPTVPLGRDLHRSAGRALERHAAGYSAASGAGLCGAGFSYALDFSAGLAAGDAAAGRCGRAVALMGAGVAVLHHRVLARYRRPRRVVGRRAGRAASWRRSALVLAGGAGAAGTQDVRAHERMRLAHASEIRRPMTLQDEVAMLNCAPSKCLRKLRGSGSISFLPRNSRA